MRPRLQIFVALFVLLLLPRSSAQSTWTLADTDWPNPMTAVVLLEGYTADEGPEGFQHAQQVWAGFIGDDLFRDHRNRWRARMVHYPSNESGVTVYGGAKKDTRYHAVQGYGGTARLLVVPSTWQCFQDAAAAGFSSNVVIIVLANTTVYCGAGGAVATVSRHSSAVEIARHEMGHTFADLADEYCTAYPGWIQQRKANSAPLSDAGNLPWSGGYQIGCQYRCDDWVRPRKDCKMNHLNVPFCDVCRAVYLAKLEARTAVQRRPLGSVPFTLSMTAAPVAVRQDHQPVGDPSPPAGG